MFHPRGCTNNRQPDSQWERDRSNHKRVLILYVFIIHYLLTFVKCFFKIFYIFFRWEICFRIFSWELVFSHLFSHRQAYGFAAIKSISLSLFNNISLSNNNALYFLAIELIRQICAISHIFSNIFQSYMRKWEKKCMKKYYISCKFEYAFDIWEKI